MAKQLRNIRDAVLSGNVALPNAANTVNSNVVDLAVSQPYPATEEFEVKITIDTATGANSKNVNAVLQHSNESNANFVNIAGLAAPILVAAGNAANVIGANVVVSVPPTTRRYIRAQATGEANGGDASDGKLTVELLF